MFRGPLDISTCIQCSTILEEKFASSKTLLLWHIADPSTLCMPMESPTTKRYKSEQPPRFPPQSRARSRVPRTFACVRIRCTLHESRGRLHCHCQSLLSEYAPHSCWGHFSHQDHLVRDGGWLLDGADLDPALEQKLAKMDSQGFILCGKDSVLSQ